MIYPDEKTFEGLSKKGNLVPVFREILADTETPVSAYLKLRACPSFLLESVVGGEKWGRYSFLGLQPSKTIKGTSNTVTVTKRRKTDSFKVGDPIGFLKEIMSENKPVERDPFIAGARSPNIAGARSPFSGGLVGYLGYDMVRFIERLPDMDRPGMDVPDMFFMLTDALLIFDSLRQTIKVLLNVRLDGKDPRKAYREAVEKINGIVEELKGPVPAGDIGEPVPSGGFVSSFGPRGAFEDAVRKAKDYIMAGDVVQVVLSQRFEKPCTVSPFDIYRALRVVNPSPYMYYMDTGDMQVVGSSPEILVRLEGDKITLRPIAGTRKRGEDDAGDIALEKELKADEKEKAEHIMLVDLGRNDVGRVAKTGSVKVTELMGVERYSHVMHMVSNVEGDLIPGLGPADVLRACFPAGTVTGAPKIRAMEIIEELEPVRRGPYAGALGYLSYSGSMDMCITIRTLIIKDRVCYVQAGAGIVADSRPEAEYDETVNKAMGRMKAVEMATGRAPATGTACRERD